MPRPRMKALPPGVYERRHASGNRTYAIRYRDAGGRSMREAAGSSIADAVALLQKREREIAEFGTARVTPRTVGEYAGYWVPLRHGEGVRTAKREGQILVNDVLPHLGAMQLAELRPRHVAAWIRTLRTTTKLSPKSIRNAHGVLSSMLSRARFDELITDNPAKGLPPGVLPDNVRVRQVAAFSRDEVERLIADPRIPEDRRMLYAIAAFTGARLGEICGMRWSDIDESARPLRRWVLRTQWNRQQLKTSSPRDVPIHAELWQLLGAWRLVGWPRLTGRTPRADDLVVPQPDGAMHTPRAGADSLHGHAAAIGIETRTPQGMRDAHSFRRSFITLARTDGAPTDILERVTHNAKGAQIDAYTYFGWETLCAAVSALRLDPRRHRTSQPETPKPEAPSPAVSAPVAGPVVAPVAGPVETALESALRRLVQHGISMRERGLLEHPTEHAKPKSGQKLNDFAGWMAEEKGFEPLVELPPRRFSKPLPSTTRPLLPERRQLITRGERVECS